MSGAFEREQQLYAEKQAQLQASIQQVGACGGGLDWWAARATRQRAAVRSVACGCRLGCAKHQRKFVPLALPVPHLV